MLGLFATINLKYKHVWVNYLGITKLALGFKGMYSFIIE